MDFKRFNGGRNNKRKMIWGIKDGERMEKKEIYYDKEELETYKKEFPACAIQLQQQADNLCVLYNQMPFKSSEKKRQIHKIKRALTFYNPNFEIEKKEKERLKEEKKKERFNQQAAQVFSPEGQAKVFSNLQPFFYDRTGNWWLWNFRDFKWELVDEIDILNMVGSKTESDIISPKERNIILNSLKQEGRKMIPKKIKPTWIQFKDIVYDISNGENFRASPEYFITNPIPYAFHQEGFIETPTLDRIFTEWVGKENIRTLYEILAYCLLPDYPIHRIFCFVGVGMNGKSCFLRLLKKFVGEDNVTSTELDTLLTSRFEITRLYKKLVCLMGETNFNEISKTGMLKKLTGQDLIGFEYKNKNPFNDINNAKILIATNNLPTTTDKTIGFYRRWMIIDFPNTFSEKKEILKDIPEEEYSCLAKKCAYILKDLLDKREFTNEGTLEDREKKYEEKSNFLNKFIKDFTTDENINGFITKNDFFIKFNQWCKENRHRELSETSLGIAMKKLGVESGKKYFDWLYNGKGGDARIWLGIEWKQDKED